MTVLHRFEGADDSHTVKLEKGFKQSFGICIVKGEVKDSPNSKVSGIFIKDIIPQTPAQQCGKLKIGDRILSINGNDVRNATEETFINYIRDAGAAITLKVQTFDQQQNSSKNESKPSKPTENGYLPNGDISNKTSSSSKPVAADSDSDEEDTRDMTGRTISAAGYEIDRASAGNAKLSKGEAETDTEAEDEYGYTTKKIKKRYGTLGQVHKTEVFRPPNTDLGLALAGNKDRQTMSCIVAGINPSGIIASANLKPGDELLEVNGTVLQNRCHLNASPIFRSITTEKIVFVVLRRPPNKSVLSVKTVTYFPVVIDETEHLFTTYKNVRLVQVQKVGSSLGIMIIEGKHSEVGAGIFISDLQAGSNAELAGLKVGEMILAINKDVLVESNYDTAAGILKRAEGVVNLVICSLKKEEEKKEDDKKKEKEKEKKDAPPPEPEKPQDPSVAEIKPNRKTLIEIKPEKKPLGCMVVGGKNSFVTTGVVVTNVYADGVIAKDNRLQPFDQIIEFNGNPCNAAEMTALKVYQLFNLPYDRITLTVWRNDPPEVEKINIDVARKPGKDLGLAMVANPKGVLISEIVSAGCADIDSRLQRGDIISKLNGDSLENTSFEACCALFKAATGKVSLEITRPKPTART